MKVFEVHVRDYSGHEIKDHKLKDGKKVLGIKCDKEKFYVEASSMAKAIELCKPEECNEYEIQAVLEVGNIIRRETTEKAVNDG